MPLLNYTTKIPAEQTAGEIVSILAGKGATEVLIEYGSQGQPAGLKWRVNTGQGPLTFALPINAAAVFQVLTQQKVMRVNPDARIEQANGTAWRIIKEWILAQMALIEISMVTMDEVFLPYLLTDGRTLYRSLVQGKISITVSGGQPMLTPPG